MALDTFTVRDYDTGDPADIRTTSVNPLSPDSDVHVPHHISEVAPVEDRISGTGHAANGTTTAVTGMLPASGERAYVSAAQVANAGLSAVLVLLQNGSGGSTLAYAYVSAGQTISIPYPSPIRTSVDTGLYFQVVDSVPSPATTNVYVSAQGYSE